MSFNQSSFNLMKNNKLFIVPILTIGMLFAGCNNNEDELTRLRDQVSTLQSQLNDAETAKTTAEATVASLQSQVTSLTQDLQSATGGIPTSVVEATLNQFRTALDQTAELIGKQVELGKTSNVTQLEKVNNEFKTLVSSYKETTDISQTSNAGMILVQGIQSLISDLVAGGETITLNGVLEEDTSLIAGNTYILDGRVTVPDGRTIIIPAGTIIKGAPGTGANASALLIARGGKIHALGTKERPIIFTYQDDPIQADGTYAEGVSAPGINVLGQWGGLIVLGKAPGSFKNDESQVQIEGIPTDDINGLYGGNDPADNSGIIQYISIRHGGSDIGEGNEINGLTLGSVGNQTVIQNVEVIANKDDGIEFFGGSVNASNLFVWGQGDDGLDIDQAYSGTIYNSVVALTNESDHGLEIDGPEGSLEGSFSLINTTIIGAVDNCQPAGGEKTEIADFRSNALGSLDKVAFKHFVSPSDVELDKEDVSSNYKEQRLTFSNIDIVNSPGCDPLVLSAIFIDKAETNKSSFSEDALNFAEIVEDGKEEGANLVEFEWTQWAHRN